MKTIYKPGQDPEVNFLMVRWVAPSGEYKQTFLWARFPGAFSTLMHPSRQLLLDYNGADLCPAPMSDAYRSQHALVSSKRFVREDVASGYPAFVLSSNARERTTLDPNGQPVTFPAVYIEFYHSPKFGATVLKQIDVVQDGSTEVTEAVDIKFHTDYDLKSIDTSFLADLANNEEQAGHLSYAAQIRAMMTKWQEALQRIKP